MKKIVLLLAVSCLVLSCHRNVKPDPNAFDFHTVTVEDSVRFPEEAVEEWMYDDMAYYLGVVDVPVTDNEALRDNIIGWMSGFLSENYDGDSQDVQAMLNFDKDEFLSLESGTPQSSNQLSLTLQEDNERYVTFFADNYLYTGGAHGMSYQEGATFSKKNGVRFDFGMFKDPMALEDLLGTVPTTDPWIMHDSVVFIYQSYEIAPYSSGLPQSRWPYAAIKDGLSDEGKSFFE